MKIKIAVIFGGKSVEHEISIISGIQVIMNMDNDKYDIVPVYLTKDNKMYIGEHIGNIESYKNIGELLKESQEVIILKKNNGVFLTAIMGGLFRKKVEIGIDMVFPVVHGTNVEDGTLQGYFKTIGVPFVGSDVLASAVGMDKYFAKIIAEKNNIPVVKGYRYTGADYADIENMILSIEKNLDYPVIVKPINLGSSVGIGIARDREELVSRIDTAFEYSGRILVEYAITELREINCSVLGDENEVIVSACEEPVHSDEILSYRDKYLNQSKNAPSKGMASLQRKIPADISGEMEAKIQEFAAGVFKCLGCSGVARIDFIIDKEKNIIYFNEINTIPGSLSFYLWETKGMSYKELLNRLIDLSLKRMREEEELTFAFDTNILSRDTLFGTKGGKV